MAGDPDTELDLGAGAARSRGTRVGRVAAEGGADVLIESIRNDPIPVEFVGRLRGELERELGGSSSAAPAYSALEAAGQMWWMCIYLWLLSARSRDSIGALIEAVIPSLR